MAKAFPNYLWKTLCSGRCFRVLKHFVPLFTLLEELGCPRPLGGLEAFAETDPASLESPDLKDFASGDLGMRLRFFESVLYKDFTLLRAAAILQAARDAVDSEARLHNLRTLRAAVANLDEEGGEFHKFSDWGLSLFQSEGRLAIAFALGDSAVERVQFANTFKHFEHDLDWLAFLLLVDTQHKPAAAITLERFFDVVVAVDDAGQRKAISNPSAFHTADFVLDLEAGVRVHTPGTLMPDEDPPPGCILCKRERLLPKWALPIGPPRPRTLPPCRRNTWCSFRAASRSSSAPKARSRSGRLSCASSPRKRK